jgi:hypothetical protein
MAGAAAGLIVARPASAAISEQIDHHRLRVRSPNLDGARIAHLTDLHCDSDSSIARIRRGVGITNSLDADVVLLTGDFVTYGKDYIATLATLLSGLRAPTCAVLGNHDHYADGDVVTKALRDVGITVLNNASDTVRIRGARLQIVGIDDVNTGHHDVGAALASATGPRDARVILGHNPRVADLVPPACADLILSGHTHGGQIAIPGVTPWIVRAAGSNYVRGFYNTPAGMLYVNRGWGTVGLPIRIGAPAEIALFHLQSI